MLETLTESNEALRQNMLDMLESHKKKLSNLNYELEYARKEINSEKVLSMKERNKRIEMKDSMDILTQN